MSETTSSIKAGRSFMMVMVTNRPWPRLNVSDIHWSDRPGRGSIYGTVRVRDGALCSRKLTAAYSPARGKISHVCSDLEADVGQMQMNLFEKVRVFLYLRSEFGVLREELLDVLCVVCGVQRDLGGDSVSRLGGDQKSRSLHAGHHREKKVQQDIRVRIERLVVEDVLEEQCVDKSPSDHDGEEAEHERPRPHHVPHPVGRTFAERELITGSHPGVFVPMGLPGDFFHDDQCRVAGRPEDG